MIYERTREMESCKIIGVTQAKLTNDKLALSGKYVASIGNFLLTFRYNLRVRESWTLSMGLIGCTET